MAPQSGTVASEFRYDPYGVPLAVSGGNVAEACPFRFQTKYWDAETGLYYFGYRYYNPSSCKWLCRDPIQEQGGINLTAYCANDPINQHDPTGLAHRESTEGLWENSVDWGVWVADDWWELPFVGTRNVLDSTLYCYENFAAAPLMAGLGWVAEKDDEYGVTEQWMNLSASIPGFGAPAGFATYALQRGLSSARIAVMRARQTRLINKIGSTAYKNSSSWLKPVAPANRTVVNSALSSVEANLKQPSLGVTLKKSGNYWIKEVDSDANFLLRWYGVRSLRYQSEGLMKLRDMAPAHIFKNGKLITRNAGRYTPGNFWKTWFEGSRRLGTPMNDIRPRNIGANDIIFDPSLDPIARGFYWAAGTMIVGAGGYGIFELLNGEE